MKKRKLLIILSIFIAIIVALLILVFSKDSDIIERIATSKIFAKNSSSSEELQKAENGILPIKISYSDLSIEGTISNIVQISDTVQQNRISSRNKKMAKIEVLRKKVDITDVEVVFNIEVSNRGNADGRVEEIIVNIPDTLSVVPESKANWEDLGEDALVCDNFGTVKAGSSKTIQLGLIGSASELMGDNPLETMLISSEEADQRIVEYDGDTMVTESNVKEIMGNTNNYSSANVIVSINTRLKDYSLILLGILVVLIVISLIVKKIIKKRKIIQ